MLILFYLSIWYLFCWCFWVDIWFTCSCYMNVYLSQLFISINVLLSRTVIQDRIYYIQKKKKKDRAVTAKARVQQTKLRNSHTIYQQGPVCPRQKSEHVRNTFYSWSVTVRDQTRPREGRNRSPSHIAGKVNHNWKDCKTNGKNWRRQIKDKWQLRS